MLVRDRFLNRAGLEGQCLEISARRSASTMGLGYFTSGVMFAILFALPALGYRFLRLNPILAFWTAYVLTRPFGASLRAPWTGRSRTAKAWHLR